MQSFLSFLCEKDEGIGLTIFDVDETLFKTKALINVVHDGKIIRKLDNQEFNTYKLKPGEQFDFGEFKNAKIFHDTSIPIWAMIKKANAIIRNATRKGSKVIVLTARANLDDKHRFLDTFRRYGIDIDKVYVERAGNLDLGSSAKNKRFTLHKYLRTGKYARVRFFDDAVSNLNSFKALQKKYPMVSFSAYHVQHDGSVKKF